LSPDLAALAVLADPVRRRLYLAVADSTEPVSRDSAATAAGVSRALAAFHLEKLVEAGLLESSFRRLTGRTGPGAGRPAKLYSRATRQLDVSVPARRYEWAARMLAGALSDVRSEHSEEALRRSARAQGESIGRERAAERARSSAPGDEGAPEPSSLAAASAALSGCGFEPVVAPGGELLLRNCPFDRLREGCREMICGMNLSLIEGVLTGLESKRVAASLEPAPGRCCVVLREAGER
jgi:predicted ArsR family transcriptional regulator